MDLAHRIIEFANPYLRCDECQAWVTGWHDGQQCSCKAPGWYNAPCGHQAAITSVCPSWGPVDGCCCRSLARVVGKVRHPVPPTVVAA